MEISCIPLVFSRQTQANYTSRQPLIGFGMPFAHVSSRPKRNVGQRTRHGLTKGPDMHTE